jgi:hypothetical protein
LTVGVNAANADGADANAHTSTPPASLDRHRAFTNRLKDDKLTPNATAVRRKLT